MNKKEILLKAAERGANIEGNRANRFYSMTRDLVDQLDTFMFWKSDWGYDNQDTLNSLPERLTHLLGERSRLIEELNNSRYKYEEREAKLVYLEEELYETKRRVNELTIEISSTNIKLYEIAEEIEDDLGLDLQCEEETGVSFIKEAVRALFEEWESLKVESEEYG
jgi:hypothetical protein